MRPFKSEKVLDERISEASLRCYHVGFEQNKFRLQPLVDVIRRVIPEYALGYYEGSQIPITDIVDKLHDAAVSVYTSEKYKTRGEFGEIILHLLLRDFCDTIPLISKIYFKDSDNASIYGFDAVHITHGRHNQKRKIWLGESKLYASGIDGIRDLSNDVVNHFASDYLRREFSLIKRKLPVDTPEIEHWREILDQHTLLDEIFDNITVPLVCTYSSDLFKDHTRDSREYIRAFTDECKKLHASLQRKTIHTNLDIILMLLPVPCKDSLNTELDRRLKAMQGI